MQNAKWIKKAGLGFQEKKMKNARLTKKSFENAMNT